MTEALVMMVLAFALTNLLPFGEAEQDGAGRLHVDCPLADISRDPWCIIMEVCLKGGSADECEAEEPVLPPTPPVVAGRTWRS